MSHFVVWVDAEEPSQMQQICHGSISARTRKMKRYGGLPFNTIWMISRKTGGWYL